MELLSNFNNNVKLAFVALLLGFVAIFIGNPIQGSKIIINTKNLALDLENNSGTVSTVELADKIIKGITDYKLIDIRDEKEYEKYNIPGSSRIDIVDLEKGDLLKNETYIIYAENDSYAAQAVMLLKAKNYKKVFRLKGGIEEWKKCILFPELSDNATLEEKQAFEKKISVSKYFGGSPIMGAASTDEKKLEVNLPKPVVNAPSGAPTGKKKPKREGC